MTPGDRALLDTLISDVYGQFVDVVEKERHLPAARVRAMADGRVLSGTEAYRLGFVDQLGTFQTAVERVKDFASIDNANLVEYQQRFDLSDLFHLFGKSESKGVKVDFGMDLPRLQAGRLYFLSPTFLH